MKYPRHFVYKILSLQFIFFFPFSIKIYASELDLTPKTLYFKDVNQYIIHRNFLNYIDEGEAERVYDYYTENVDLDSFIYGDDAMSQLQYKLIHRKNEYSYGRNSDKKEAALKILVGFCLKNEKAIRYYGLDEKARQREPHITNRQFNHLTIRDFFSRELDDILDFSRNILDHITI